MPATPTPAMAVEPSLPTHIMSMVGPSMFRLELTTIGQDILSRLLMMLPCVQSGLGLGCLTPRPAEPYLFGLAISVYCYTCLRFHRPVLK